MYFYIQGFEFMGPDFYFNLVTRLNNESSCQNWRLGPETQEKFF